MRRWPYGKRVFTSAMLHPPTPEEVAAHFLPVVDTWNAREQRMGRALMQVCFDGTFTFSVYQMMRSCGSGSITHWRWSDIAELNAGEDYDSIPF